MTIANARYLLENDKGTLRVYQSQGDQWIRLKYRQCATDYVARAWVNTFCPDVATPTQVRFINSFPKLAEPA